jgi:hypothetical protein
MGDLFLQFGDVFIRDCHHSPAFDLRGLPLGHPPNLPFFRAASFLALLLDFPPIFPPRLPPASPPMRPICL